MKPQKWEETSQDWKGKDDERYWLRRLCQREYMRQLCKIITAPTEETKKAPISTMEPVLKEQNNENQDPQKLQNPEDQHTKKLQSNKGSEE